MVLEGGMECQPIDRDCPFREPIPKLELPSLVGLSVLRTPGRYRRRCVEATFMLTMYMFVLNRSMYIYFLVTIGSTGSRKLTMCILKLYFQRVNE